MTQIPTRETRHAQVSLRHMSIRARIFLLVLAILLPISGAVAWFLVEAARYGREDADARVRILASNAAEALANQLDDTGALLKQLAARPLVRALDPKNCDPLVAEFVKLDPRFLQLGLRDAQGDIVCTYLPNPVPRLDPKVVPWFAEGMRSDGFTASDAWPGRRTGRWVTVLTHAVKDASGTTRGVLALPVDLLALGQRVLASVPKNAVVTVTDRRGVILMRSSEAEAFVGKPTPPQALEATRNMREGSLSVQGPDGVQRLYTFQTIPGLEWRVVSGVPEADALSRYRNVLRSAVAAAVGLLLVALFLAWRIGAAIVKPIAELAGTASKIASGDVTARAGPGGPFEIHAVARQFNKMLDARDQSEALLRESEESLRITLGSIGDAVIATDREGRITRMNATAERLTGWSQAEASGRELVEVFRIVDSNTREPAHDPVQKVLASGEVVTLSNHTALLARDGTEIQISDSAAPIRQRDGAIAGVVLVFMNVTERYRAQQAILESERRLKYLVANLPGYVYRVANDPAYTPQYLSKGVLGVTGYPQADYMVDRTVRLGDEIDPADRDRVLKTVQDAVSARLPYQCEYRIHAKSGELKWVWERGRGVFGPQGELVAREGYVTDISERKRAEDAGASLEAQLRESQKMEAIGTLAGGIAHDFNNIIGTILGNADLARADAGANLRLQESLEEILKAGGRARDLVQQILSFSRRQPTERRPIETGAVVADAARLLRSTLPARVELDWTVAEATPPVRADPTQFVQVLLNLGVNAAQAMQGKPGRITIRVEPVALDAAAARALSAELQPGPHVRITVSDTGQGMDAATQARIFEPFFTTKPLGEGTGLGLSVVHGIVHAHDGVVTVQSEPALGTRFDLYFPAYQGASGALRVGPAAAAVVEGSGQHVVYIDDDEALVFLFTRLLQRRGYRASGYVDHKEALAAIRTDPLGVDLVVTDYNMPGMSGLDVVRAVREIRSDLPVAVASGFITDELKELAAEVGVTELVFKANVVEEFCDVVQRLVPGPRT